MNRYKGHNSLAEMISTHTDKWRDGLALLREKAVHQDDKDYYAHELSALVDIECAASADLISDVECAAVQLQEPVNDCGDECGCPYNKRLKQLEGLRALRLWHWQAVLRLRVYADDADMRKSDSEHYNKRANWHLTQVQLLNDFFPIGDTAEHGNE